MTGRELREARRILGEGWGLGRPLGVSELGRLLQLHSRDPGTSVHSWEVTHPSGPAVVAVEAWLDGLVYGLRPRQLDEVIWGEGTGPRHRTTTRDVEIGGRVRDRRLRSGLTLAALGVRLGVTYQQIQNYEAGKNRINSRRLLEIAEALGVPVEDLVGPAAPGTGALAAEG